MEKIFNEIIESGELSFKKIINEMRKCKQNNPHHFKTVWEHTSDVFLYTLHETDNQNLIIAALLHDCGKPFVKSVNKKTGYDQFIGHEELSAKLAEYILKNDKEFIDECFVVKNITENDIQNICKLIKCHDLSMHMTIKNENKDKLLITPENIQKQIDKNRFTKNELRDVLFLCLADVMGQCEVATINGKTTTLKDKVDVIDAINDIINNYELRYY